MKHPILKTLTLLTAIYNFCFAQSASAAEPQKCNEPQPGQIVEVGETYWSGECVNGLANGLGYTYKFLIYPQSGSSFKPSLSGDNTVKVTVGMGNMNAGVEDGEWFVFDAPDYKKFGFNQKWQLLDKKVYTNRMLISSEGAIPDSAMMKADSGQSQIDNKLLNLIKNYTFSDSKQKERISKYNSSKYVDVISSAQGCKVERYHLRRDSGTDTNPNSKLFWTGKCSKQSYSDGYLVPDKGGVFVRSIDGNKIDLMERCLSDNPITLCIYDKESYFLNNTNEILKMDKRVFEENSGKYVQYNNQQLPMHHSITMTKIQPDDLPDWAKDLGKPLNQVRNPELVALLQANNIVPVASANTNSQQATQVATQNNNAILVKAGKCQLYANTPPQGKVDWKGACVKGFANGEGITRYYNADKKLFAIGKDTYQNGQYQNTKDAYFINDGAILQMAKDPNQPAQQVTKEDLPVWAMEIAKVAPKKADAAKPKVNPNAQEGVSF